MTIDFQYALPMAALIVSTLAVIRVIQVQRRNAALAGRLSEITGSLENVRHCYGDLQEKYCSSIAFQQNLSEAAITTRLQVPRMTAQNRPATVAAPERYRYIQRLAETGMDAEEIASVLSISSHESRQLVNLSRLAGGRSDDVSHECRTGHPAP